MIIKVVSTNLLDEINFSIFHDNTVSILQSYHVIHVTNNLEKPNDLQTSPSQMTNNIDHTHTDESVTTKNKGIEIFYTRLIHFLLI